MSKLLFTDLFCLFQIQEAEKRQGSLGSQEWAIITLQQYVLRYHKPLAQAGHWRKHLKFSLSQQLTQDWLWLQCVDSFGSCPR